MTKAWYNSIPEGAPISAYWEQRNAEMQTILEAKVADKVAKIDDAVASGIIQEDLGKERKAAFAGEERKKLTFFTPADVGKRIDEKGPVLLRDPSTGQPAHASGEELVQKVLAGQSVGRAALEFLAADLGVPIERLWPAAGAATTPPAAPPAPPPAPPAPPQPDPTPAAAAAPAVQPAALAAAPTPAENAPEAGDDQGDDSDDDGLPPAPGASTTTPELPSGGAPPVEQPGTTQPAAETKAGEPPKTETPAAKTRRTRAPANDGRFTPNPPAQGPAAGEVELHIANTTDHGMVVIAERLASGVIKIVLVPDKKDSMVGNCVHVRQAVTRYTLSPESEQGRDIETVKLTVK